MIGVYVIDGIDKRAFLLGNREFVLEADVTATKNERDVAAAEPVPVKYPVTVGGKVIGDFEP